MKTFKSIFYTDVPNRVGWIYPKSVINTALVDYMRKVKNGIALGESGSCNGAEIGLERVSHVITDIVEVPEGFEITSKILDTPAGLALQYTDESTLKYGLKFIGTVNGDIITDCRIIGFNILRSLTCLN